MRSVGKSFLQIQKYWRTLWYLKQCRTELLDNVTTRWCTFRTGKLFLRRFFECPYVSIIRRKEWGCLRCFNENEMGLSKYSALYIKSGGLLGLIKDNLAAIDEADLIRVNFFLLRFICIQSAQKRLRPSSNRFLGWNYSDLE